MTQALFRANHNTRALILAAMPWVEQMLEGYSTIESKDLVMKGTRTDKEVLGLDLIKGCIEISPDSRCPDH